MKNKKIFSPSNFYKEGFKKNIQLTSVLSAYILYRGMVDGKRYVNELKFFDQILPIGFDKEIDAYLKFRKKGMDISMNRYEAIKNEISEDKGILVHFACGLSPLGLVYATENPQGFAFDSDLSEVVDYRKENEDIEIPLDYQIDVVNLLDSSLMKKYSDKINLCLRKNPVDNITMVIEGLTFYLSPKEQDGLHKNIIDFSKRIDIPNTKLIISYYVSDKPMKEDTEASIEEFKSVFECISGNQKSFFKTPPDVKGYLDSKGYKNVHLSEYSMPNNPHKIFICDI